MFIDETGLSTKMARLRGRAPRGERCRAGAPHGHVWTPPRTQEESLVQSAARDRVLPCVRPLLRLVMAAGPYGSSRIRSTSLERARSAPHAPGSPDPASPTLRHTCPLTSSRRYGLTSVPFRRVRPELGSFLPSSTVPRRYGHSCSPVRRSLAWAAYARASVRARILWPPLCAWPSARRRSLR